MKKIMLSMSAAAALLLSSCGGGEETATTDGETIEGNKTQETCFYSYAKGSASVNWTAFKTTEKMAVGGQFNTVNAKSEEKSTKIPEVLMGTVFNIPTASTFTENPDRDAKLKEFFFGAMEATDIILGQVKSVEGDNEKGTCTFFLTMNNIEKEVTLEYTVNDTELKMTGEIDVMDWNAGGAIESINKACEDLHKGSDGVSKTWSTVELTIGAALNKDCH